MTTPWQRDVDERMRRRRVREKVRYWLGMAAIALLAGGSFWLIVEWRG